MSNQQFNKSLSQPQGKFQFNSEGICENPEQLISHQGNVYSYILSVCEGPVGWMAGYELEIRGKGARWEKKFPSKKGEIYFSKKVASIDIANQALEYFNKYTKTKHRDLTMLRAFIEHLGGEKANLSNKVAMDTFNVLTGDNKLDASEFVASRLKDIAQEVAPDLLNNKVTSGNAAQVDKQEMNEFIAKELQFITDLVAIPADSSDDHKDDATRYMTNETTKPKDALIQFYKQRAYKGMTELRLFAALNFNLKGDWMTDPMSMDDAFYRTQEVLRDFKPDQKYISTFVLERADDGIIIFTNHPGKDGKKLPLCGFKPVPPPYVRPQYSDEDLAEFEIIVNKKLVIAQKELKYLQEEIIDKKNGSANVIQEVEKIVERQRIYIARLNVSLNQIKIKSFGVCAKTGQLIDKVRLRQWPTASTQDGLPGGADSPPILTKQFIPAADAEKINAEMFIHLHTDQKPEPVTWKLEEAGEIPKEALEHLDAKDKDLAAVWIPGAANDINTITPENALKHKSMFAWKIPQTEKNFDHFTRLLQKGKFDPGLTKKSVEQLQENQRIFLIQLQAGMEQVKFILSTNNKKQTMAKIITPQPKAQDPAFSQDMIVPITSIINSPTNKFQREEWELDPAQDPEMAELVKSVKQTGIIQNLVVRPNEKPGKYYLVVGERRLTAAKLNGIKEVRVKVISLNDEDAFEMQITENLQRKNPHPLKEALTFQAYMDQTHCNVDDLVARFAKTKEYITQRLSFLMLIPELRKDFHANKMGPGQAILFARLTAEDQKDCFINCKVMHGAAAGSYKLIDDIKSYISSAIMMDLGQVAWDLKDVALVTAAGSCALCVKRSGSDLFGDVKEKDRCFDKKCFHNKATTFAIKSVTETLETDPDVTVIRLQSHDIILPEIRKILETRKTKVFDRHTHFDLSDGKGSIKAMVVAGAHAGTIQDIKMKKIIPTLNSSPSAGGTKKSTPVISLQRKIDDAKAAVENVHEEIETCVAGALLKKLTDFKPYNSPDPKKLTKWENVALLMAVVRECGFYKINDLIKKIKPAGIKPTDPGYEVQQYAAIPVELANYIMREYITNFLDEDDHAYLIRKMAEENAGIKIVVVETETKKKYGPQLEAAIEKLKKLQTPPVAKAKPVAKKTAKK